MLRKKNKNKKIDIYTALMLPLMTMFLLNIGLVATTWAWYTARVSSGVNTIKAGVDVSVQVFEKGTDNPIEVQNNSVSLEAGKEYSFTFTSGSAANGYYALITVSNSTVATNPITNLFMTTTYADEPTSSYVVVLSLNQNDANITMRFLQNKDVSISYIWKPLDSDPAENHTITYGDRQYELVEIGQTITNEVVYTVHFIGTDNSSIDKTYTVDKNDVEIELSAPEGYYLQPEEDETAPVTQRSYPVSQFSNNELTVTVVRNEEGTNNNSTADPAEEDTVMVEAAPESVTGNVGSQSIPSGTESATEPTIPGQEQITTPDEPTPPVQEPEQSTAPSETETNLTRTNGQTVVGEKNDEVGGTGEEETAIEENMEVVDNAQSESGD